uniref:Uncharacterized protein n=1 Tax=Streptomyces avermitilis TaxID=33903 RepID=A0A499VUV3_STRAX|nr:hypothetical protein SAVMC3_60700 [Streptomyces avermitilis]
MDALEQDRVFLPDPRVGHRSGSEQQHSEGRTHQGPFGLQQGTSPGSTQRTRKTDTPASRSRSASRSAASASASAYDTNTSYGPCVCACGGGGVGRGAGSGPGSRPRRRPGPPRFRSGTQAKYVDATVAIKPTRAIARLAPSMSGILG